MPSDRIRVGYQNRLWPRAEINCVLAAYRFLNRGVVKYIALDHLQLWVLDLELCRDLEQAP